MKITKRIFRCILKSIKYGSLFVVYLYAAMFFMALASKFPWLERINQSGSYEYAFTFTFKAWLYSFMFFFLFYMNQLLFYMIENTALYKSIGFDEDDNETLSYLFTLLFSIAEICLLYVTFIGL